MAEHDGARIVTCDSCGTPYAALNTGEDLIIVGEGDGACPNCAGTAFSRLTL